MCHNKEPVLLFPNPRYELNCKRPEVAQSYLDQAVRIDPEETLVCHNGDDDKGENSFGGGDGDASSGGGVVAIGGGGGDVGGDEVVVGGGA